MSRMSTAARAALCSVVLLTEPARGASFEPNHIFVSCGDGRILEFDPGGGFRRELSIASGPLGGLAFGPDGNLYVAQLVGGKLLRIAPDGSSSATTIDLTGYPTDLASNGRDGLLAVCRDKSMIVNIPFDPASGPYLATAVTTAYGKPVAVEVEANGHWTVTAWASGSAPAGLKRTVPFGSVAYFNAGYWNPTGLVIEGDRSIVADPSVGIKIAKAGAAPWMISTGPLVGAFDVVRGPNGNLLVTCSGDVSMDALVEVDEAGMIVRQFSHPALKKPHRIAVAPLVFDIKLSGRSVQAEAHVDKLAGEIARLSVAPYSGIAQIEFPALSFLSPESLKSRIIPLRSTTVAGVDGVIQVRGTAQTFEQQPYSLSFALELKGVQEDVGGALLAKSVRGTLHVTGVFDDAMTTASVKFKGKRVAD